MPHYEFEDADGFPIDPDTPPLRAKNFPEVFQQPTYVKPRAAVGAPITGKKTSMKFTWNKNDVQFLIDCGIAPL